MSHGTVLDCGCYIREGGGRVWCPTCADGGPRGTPETPTSVAEREELEAYRRAVFTYPPEDSTDPLDRAGFEGELHALSVVLNVFCGWVRDGRIEIMEEEDPDALREAMTDASLCVALLKQAVALHPNRRTATAGRGTSSEDKNDG